MEDPQKIKNRLPYNWGISLLDVFAKKTKTQIFHIIQNSQGSVCIYIYTYIYVSLHYLAYICIQPYIYVYLAIKEWYLVICDNTDGPWVYYAE